MTISDHVRVEALVIGRFMVGLENALTVYISGRFHAANTLLSPVQLILLVPLSI